MKSFNRRWILVAVDLVTGLVMWSLSDSKLDFFGCLAVAALMIGFYWLGAIAEARK